MVMDRLDSSSKLVPAHYRRLSGYTTISIPLCLQVAKTSSIVLLNTQGAVVRLKFKHENWLCSLPTIKHRNC